MKWVDMVQRISGSLKRLRIGHVNFYEIMTLQKQGPLPNLTHLALAEYHVLTFGLTKELAKIAPGLQGLVILRLRCLGSAEANYSDLGEHCSQLQFIDVQKVDPSHLHNPPIGFTPSRHQWPLHTTPLKVVGMEAPGKDRWRLHPSNRITGPNVKVLKTAEEKAEAKAAFLQPWILCKFNDK